jgi:hypothetical protein
LPAKTGGSTKKSLKIIGLRAKIGDVEGNGRSLILRRYLVACPEGLENHENPVRRLEQETVRMRTVVNRHLALREHTDRRTESRICERTEASEMKTLQTSGGYIGR